MLFPHNGRKREQWQKWHHLVPLSRSHNALRSQRLHTTVHVFTLGLSCWQRVFSICPLVHAVCVSLQRSSVGRDVRRSVLQPVNSAVRQEQTILLRLRRYAPPCLSQWTQFIPLSALTGVVMLEAPSHLVFFGVFLKRRRGFSVFCVFLGFSSGLLRSDNPPLTGEQGQFGFCYILGDYWSKMKCWLTVLTVNKSQRQRGDQRLVPS